jgi:hypothetical protein
VSHLENQITEKMRGWSVETRDAGACFVPGDVVSVPDWLKSGEPILLETDSEGKHRADREVFEVFRSRLSAYVKGRTILAIEVCEGYFARLSAPGYLDCTSWSFYNTKKEARDALRDI